MMPNVGFWLEAAVNCRDCRWQHTEDENNEPIFIASE